MLVRMMTKKSLLKYHARIVKSKTLDELRDIIRELLHEEHGEPKDSLLALAMANKRIIYNVDYFDSIAEAVATRESKRKII
jgi:hypothetical protein